MEQLPPKRSWLRIAQGLGLGSIAIGIAGALLKSWATYWFGAPPVALRSAEPAGIVQVSASVPASLPLTIDDLLRRSPISLMRWQELVEVSAKLEMKERERRFREYLGREVVWEGYFEAFHRNQFNPTPERAFTVIVHESYANLHSTSLLGPPFVRCWLPESAAEDLAKLKHGEWIVIKGTPGDPLMSGSVLCTDLEPCQILAAGKVRNVQQAVEETQSVLR